jgi:hypothetical protein
LHFFSFQQGLTHEIVEITADVFDPDRFAAILLVMESHVVIIGEIQAQFIARAFGAAQYATPQFLEFAYVS